MPSSAPLAIATITIKARDKRAVARFWRDLLGYAVAPNHSESVLLRDPDGHGPAVLIQPTLEPSQGPGTHQIIHLDLRPAARRGAVTRALQLGATRADIGQAGDEGWVVLADPEGNVFCILESAAEHARRCADDPGSATPID